MANRWREGWPLIAMQGGALVGAVGMVGGQIAQGATPGQVVFTAVIAAGFLLAVSLVVRGTRVRWARTGVDRAPSVQPSGLVRTGLWFTALMMGILAVFGTCLAVIAPRPEHGWHALAYWSVTICATGAAVLIGRMRREFDEQYRTG